MLVRIAGIQDTTTDGIGMGLAIFFQGCTMKCEGCQNPELWDKWGGEEYDTKDLEAHLKYHKGFYNSVVYTGGDPLDQVVPLIDLMERVEKLGMFQIIYTGRLWEHMPDAVIKHADIVVDGKYMPELATGRFPASSNQFVMPSSSEAYNLFVKNKILDR